MAAEVELLDGDAAAVLAQLLHSNAGVWVAYGAKWAVQVKGKSDGLQGSSEHVVRDSDCLLPG